MYIITHQINLRVPRTFMIFSNKWNIQSFTKKAYRVNEISKLLNTYQSTIPNEKLSKKKITTDSKNTHIFSQKPPIVNQRSESQNIQMNKKKFLTMFNFQHSHINQQ